MKIKELEERFGSYTIDGKVYVLLDQPDATEYCPNSLMTFCDSRTPFGFNGDWFHASAILADDVPDEDGYQPIYHVWWECLPDYDPEEDAPDAACDWDNPYSAEVTRSEYCQESGWTY